MGILDERYGTDRRAENDGVWYSLEDDNGKEVMAFLIARQSADNTRFLQTVDKVHKKHRREIEAKTMSPAKSRRLGLETFVRGCLLDWRGAVHWSSKTNETDAGELCGDYTHEKGYRLMREFPDLHRDLEAFSGSIEAYRADIQEVAEKNS